jgi:hypothetical protein
MGKNRATMLQNLSIKKRCGFRFGSEKERGKDKAR